MGLDAPGFSSFPPGFLWLLLQEVSERGLLARLERACVDTTDEIYNHWKDQNKQGRLKMLEVLKSADWEKDSLFLFIVPANAGLPQGRF